MQSMKSRAARLAEQAERDFPESWIPSADDPQIIGEFVRLDRATTRRGEPAPIVVLRTEDGAERGVWLLHIVLLDEFKRVRPKPGELVAVRYLGKKTSAAGQSYHGYRVVVDRTDQGVDWGALDEPSEEGLLDEPASDEADDIPF